jgi:SAM-dependent methyltransferase/methyltransferase-like protein
METWKTPALSFAEEPYQGRAFPHGHPEHLAALGALFGIAATPPERCRVLELGCGDGWNLIPMVEELPGSEFVGVDLDAARLAPGTAACEALKLDRLKLVTDDLAKLGDRLGRFDYVIAHGVYSWTSDAVREVFFERLRALLTERGIAYVSANVYPGWHLAETSRHLALFHAHVKQPRAGEAFLKELRQVTRFFCDQMPRDTPPRALASEQYRGVSGMSDYLLAFDQLTDTRPAYFEELVRRAEAGGLRYVTDAILPGGQWSLLAPNLKRGIGELTSDRILREQYADFALLPAFRQLVLCRDEQAPDELRLERLRELFVAANLRPPRGADPGARGAIQYEIGALRLQVESPLVKTALAELAAAYPQALAFPELVARASARVPNVAHPEQTLVSGLAEFVTAGVLSTRTRAFTLAATPGERPSVSAVSRYQLERLGSATNRHHLIVNLPAGFDREALQRLDGRPRQALAAELAALVEQGKLSAAEFTGLRGAELGAAVETRLEKTLAEAARLALLMPER